MNTTLEPMQAALIGGWELLFVLGFFLCVAVILVGGAVTLIYFSAKRIKSKSEPVRSPPVVPSTQVFPRKCPQCGAPLKPDAPEGLCPACLMQHGIATEGGAPPGTPPFTPPPFAELQKLFPQLEILEPIGQGGMGAVYKARQPALDRLVALKILAPRGGGDLDFAGRFTREARALAKLSHPNIVAVYDFGQVKVGQASSLPSERESASGEEKAPQPNSQAQTGKMPVLHYFIMEFVDGLNLRQLEQAGKLSPREALTIIPQICEALQFAHDEGVVHRDIKPENVLLDKKGRVKIADFGLAKILGREAENLRLTGARDVMGTPHYMAPEQVEHPQAVDHRADIYSLGVVFYEMLTGELPLGKFQPPSQRVQVDVRLDEVVLRALEKEPARRYQHASDVKTRVETIAHTSSGAGAEPNAAAFMQTALARDYQLDLGHCLSQGWNLVKRNFWPLVAIYALFFVLSALAETSGLAISGESAGHAVSLLSLVLSGPLTGGLYFYFLKTIRDERPKVDAAFAGFSNRFLHLFLGDFVATLLIMLGLLCLIVPGIYLFVAWKFTLALIIDKRLDFWSAMELSRKAVTKHWWKLFGLALVLMLLKLAGFLCLVVGLFITAPIAVAALLYAYEDIFGPAAQAASQLPAGASVAQGSGTCETAQIESPGGSAPTGPAQKPDHFWRWFAVAAVSIPLALILIAIVSIAIGYRAFKTQPNLTVSGLVVDAATGHPIAGARVDDNRYGAGTRKAPQQAWTDANGHYELKTWSEEHTVAASAPGYETKLETVFTKPLTTMRKTRLDFQLLPVINSNTFIGKAWFPQGDSIEITSAERSADQMIVKGHYHLVSHDSALLAFYITSTETNPIPTDSRQQMHISKGGGDFELIHPLATAGVSFWHPGLPHVSMYADGKPFASLYFGTHVEAREESQASWITNEAPASAETWSPTLAPGEKPDLQKILDEAKDLMNRHAYEESLQHYLWYRNHEPEYGDSYQNVVRITSAISGWVELGRRYPKAKQALLEIRDQDTRALEEGNGYLDLFREVQAINRELGKEDATYELFKIIRGKDPQLARQGYFWVEDLLVAKGDYQWCYDYMGDPQLRFDSIRRTYEMGVANQKRQAETLQQAKQTVAAMNRKNGWTNSPTVPPPDTSAITKKGAQDRFVGQVRQLVEILVSTAHKAEAQKIRDEALTVLDDPRLKSAVEDAKERVQRFNAGGAAHSGAARLPATPGQTTRINPATGLPTPSGNVGTSTFGPLIERVVSGEGDTNRRFIDFDSGKLFAAADFFGAKAEPSPGETQAWWRKTGIDAMGDTSSAVRGLVGFEMTAVPAPNEEWDKATPARLDYYLTLAKAGTPVTMSGKGDLPDTFVIRTREGGRGLLQITGFTNSPPGVIIRYRLIRAL